MGVSRPRFELQSPKHEALHFKFKDHMGCSMLGRSKKFTQNFLPQGKTQIQVGDHTKLNIELRMLGMKRYEWLGNEDRSLHTKTLCMCDIFLHLFLKAHYFPLPPVCDIFANVADGQYCVLTQGGMERDASQVNVSSWMEVVISVGLEHTVL